MHTRNCPECGEEFRPEIVRCSDCGAELVDRHEEEGHTVVPPGSAPPAGEEARYVAVFSAIGSDALREAADAVAAAGLPFRATGSALGFQLLVRAQDRAQAVDALGGREGALLFQPESATGAGEEAAPCPSCGARVAAGTLECPECQLVLGGAAGTCQGCGAAVDPSAETCASCGDGASR